MENSIKHGPWEDYQQPVQSEGPWTDFQNDKSIYVMSPADRRRVHQSFAGDPLAFIADDSERAYVRQVTETMGDRDVFRKRMALAAYFTIHNPGSDFRFNLSNLDGILEKFYKKKTTPDAAYQDLSLMLAGPQTDFRTELGKTLTRQGKEYAAAAGSGVVDFAATAASSYLKYGKWGLDATKKILAPLLPENAEKFLKVYSDLVFGRYGREVRKSGKELNKELDTASNANPDFILDLITGDFDKVSVDDFTKALIRSTPQMAYQIGLAAAAPWLAPTFIGAETLAQKDYEVDEKQPDWGKAKRLSYIGISAVNEALFEMVTAKIAGGSLTRKAGAKIIQKGLMKYLGKSVSEESLSEMDQQLLSNVTDLLYNIDGDTEILSGAQLAKRVFAGVLESGFLGGVWGSPAGFVGFSSARDMMGQVEKIRRKNEKTVSELTAKNELSKDETIKLETAQKILELEEPQMIMAADYTAAIVQEMNETEAILSSEEFQKEMADAAPGVTEEEIIESLRAQRRINLNSILPHNAQEIYDRTKEYSKLFKDIPFVVVDDWSQVRLPGVSIRPDAAAFTRLETGEIYINANKVRPHNLMAIMLHEAIGHKGLRAVVPEKDLNTLLDQVYKDHFQDKEFERIAATYFEPRELTDENGESYMGVSLDTAEEQRIAAEEYIAHLAQKGVPKPSWWKEFLQKIRMWWSNTRFGSELHMTDAQIETLLARSARKMRSSVVKKNLTTEGDGVRFSVDGIEGQKTATAVTVPDLPVDMKNTAAVRQYLYEQFKGREVQIKSDGRWTFFNRQGLEDTLKRRGEHRNSFPSLDNAVEESYPVGYETVDQRHGEKRKDLKGQFIYAALLDIHGEQYIATIKLDDTAADKRAYFKDISIKKRSLYVGQPQTVVDPSADRSITIQQLIDYVKGDFAQSEIFSEKMPVVPDYNGMRFSVEDQTESVPFKEWFQNSKVVDRDGKPLVVYHGSSADFTVFDHRFAYRNGAAEGRGFYFTSDKSKAEGYKTDNGKLFEVYLRLQKPLDPDKLTITKAEVEKIIRSIDTDGMYVSDYAEDDRGYPGKIWHNKAVKSAVNAIYDSSDNNADIVAEIYSVFGQGDALAKITEATGYDGFVKDDVFVVFNPAQIKSATDNIGTFDPENPDIRFSLADYDEQTQDDIIAILRPFVRQQIDMEPERYIAYLKEKNVNIPDEDAAVFFRLAVIENDKAARERIKRARDQWLFENFPLYGEVAEFAGGADFKIKPAGHEGEEFTGSFISPEYIKYSLKRSQGKKESDKSYKKYLANRKEKLANAEGMAIDEISEHLSRKLGQDEHSIREQILDFFRHLKKKDLYHEYTQFKNDALALDKEQARLAKEEFMQQEQFRIEDEALKVIEAGFPIDDNWIRENRKVFQELYKRLFNGKEPPHSPSMIDIEAINSALMNDQASNDGSAASYKEGKNAAQKEYREKLKAEREKAYEEFTQKLLQIKAKVMQSKTDVLRLQREAAEFAEHNLPPERRSLFTRGIIGLLEHSNVPSGKYPEGRREFEFRKLIADMTQEAADSRKKTALADIREMLDNYKVSRTFKGIPVSKAPSVQGQVTEISRITRMTAGALNTYFGLQSQTMAQTEEGTPVWEDARTKAELAAMFGNLEVKSADEITRAKEHLEDLILRGKADIKYRMRERLQSIRSMRSKVIDNLSGSEVDTTGKDAQKFNTFLLKNRTLDSLLMISANTALRNFANTPQAEFIKEYTYAQEREKTRLRHLDQDFRQAVKDIFGFDGIMGWKKFLDEVNAPVQGVVRSVYTAKVEEGNTNYFLVGKRPAVRKQINWRIAEYAMDKYGDEISQVFKRPDIRHARELLKEYGTLADDYAVFGLGDRDRFMVFSLDSTTGQVTEFEVPSRALDRRIFTAWNLQDIGKRFVRKQLEDVSAGVVPVKSEFSSEAEDAQYQIINENDKTDLSVEFIADPPKLKAAAEEIPDLTINKALQLILEWEQSDYKDAFEWNGFSQKTMDQLYQAVGDKYLRLAYWMRDYIQKDSEALDKVSREKYGVPLPRILNYWMGAFQGVSRQKTADNGLGRNLGAMSMNPSFLIARKGHLKAPDINAEAISMFLDHVQKQVHFVENNDVVFKMKSVFNDIKVKQAMNSTLGKNVTDDILRRITEYAQGGGMEGKGYISDLFNRFTKYYAPAKIGFSLPSMIKQIAGSTAYAYEIPLKEYLKYSARTYKLDGDFKKFARFAWKSDFLQNRFSGGLDKDLVYMMNHALNSEKFSVFSSFLLDTGSLPLRWGDVVAVIKGGYPVYAYTRDQALANGATPEEAHQAGEFAWMKATNETQQSSNITSQNYFMANPTAGRILTLFRSNAIQTLDLVLRSIDEVKLGGMTQATKNKLARQLLISHVVIPANMFLVSQIWANGLDVEEWDWEELVVGMLWGSWEGIIFAEFIKKGTDMIAKRLAGKGYFSRPSSIVPTLDNAGNLISSFSRLTGDKELSHSDVAGAIQSLGDALMVGGAAYAPAGEFGAVISALGMRSKQVLKWFENKK